MQYHCDIQLVLAVPPTAFNPPPKVNSSVIALWPRDLSKLSETITDIAHFEMVVRQAFSQRRKTIRNCLKGLCDDAVFAKASIDPSLRAENLSVEDFVRLCNSIG